MATLDRSKLRREFESTLGIRNKLNEESLFILNEGLKSSGIKFHSIASRVKTFESFIAKAERKNIVAPFEEIRDLVGLCVVCLFLSDIERVAELVRNSFDVLQEDNKIEGHEVASFGYMSLHFTAQMRKTHSGPRYDTIARMPFEIQVRTIAMDAWATTSHYLDYKTDTDVPADLRRDFYALSGLFYVADKHFEMFFKSRQAVRRHIGKTLGHERPSLDQELNLDSLSIYLKTKFPNREQPRPSSASELVTQLAAHNVRGIQQLDEAIDSNLQWFLAREKETPPGDADDGLYAAEGVIRVILMDKVSGKNTKKRAKS